MGARARLITTSLTAAATVGTVAATADAESGDVDPTGRAAGALAAAVGDVWETSEEMAAPDAEAVDPVDEPVRIPARLRIRVSG